MKPIDDPNLLTTHFFDDLIDNRTYLDINHTYYVDDILYELFKNKINEYLSKKYDGFIDYTVNIIHDECHDLNGKNMAEILIRLRNPDCKNYKFLVVYGCNISSYCPRLYYKKLD